MTPRSSLAEAAAELAGARWVAYRTLAACFLEPSPVRLATLRAAVPELRRRTRPLAELAPGPAWRALLRALEGLDGDAAGIAQEHATLFLAGVRGRACPPYASAHLVRTGYEGAEVVAAVGGAYREAGYAASGPDLPDHVAVEMDFLGELARREAHAGAEAARDLRERELSFLRTHLLPWLPRFVERLVHASPDGFYRWPARAALAVARHDEVLLVSLGAGRGVA